MVAVTRLRKPLQRYFNDAYNAISSRSSRVKARMYRTAKQTMGMGAVAGTVAGSAALAQSLAAQAQQQKKQKKKVTGKSRGSYGTLGKFSRKLRKKLNYEEQYAKTGAVVKRETSGTVQGIHWAMASHSVYAIDDVTNAIWSAVLRKLFKKAGIEIDSLYQTLPGTATDPLNGNASQTFRVVLGRIDKTRPLVMVPNYTAITPGVTSNLYDLAKLCSSNAVTMYGREGAFNSNANNEIFYIFLYTLDAGGDAKLSSSINLQNEIVTIYGKSQLKIQNRTTTDADGDIDVVTRMPIIGKRYVFNSGVPSARLQEVQGLCQMSFEQGCLTGSQVYVKGEGRLEPPLKTAFRNCKGANGVKLEPAEIKGGSIFHTWTGSIFTFYKVFRRDTSQNQIDPPTTFQSAIYYYPGKSEMYIFEDTIDLASDANVTLAFEIQKEVGAKLRTLKKRSMLSANEKALNFSFPVLP